MGKDTVPFYNNYETMRKFVSRLAIYGCFIDILGNGNRGKTNQDTAIIKARLRLERQLGSSYMIDKCEHIEHDRYTNDPNILKNTYKERYASINMLALVIVILYYLSKYGDLKNVFGSKFSNDSTYKVLDAMINEGLIKKENGIYSLTDDIFEGMDHDDLSSLYCASGFFAMKAPFAVPGLFLQDTIELYTKEEFSSPFIFQHRFPHHITNDNQAHIILDAILNKRKITISRSDKPPANVTPVKLIYNFQTGVQKVLVTENGKAWIEYMDDIYVNGCDEDAEISETADIKPDSDGDAHYIEAEFVKCPGYGRLFPKNTKLRDDVIQVDYSHEKTNCLRFTGHIKLTDKDSAEEYTKILTEMQRLNKAQKFDVPVNFRFMDDTGENKDLRSDVCFEMISKNRLIELVLKLEDPYEYRKLRSELEETFKNKGIKNLVYDDVPVRTTALEREFISMMLTDKQACSLLTDNCLKLLRERLPEIKWQDAFEAEYTYKEKVVFRKKMQFIINAIKENRRFGYTNGSISGTAFPYKLLYSQRRRKFQLIVFGRKDSEEKDRLVLLDVHSLRDLKYIGNANEADTQAAEDAIRSKLRSVRLFVNGTDKHNFRKSFTLMSHYNRNSFYQPKKKVFEMNVYYYDFDKPELVQDILSLGKAVIVEKKDADNYPSEIYKLVMEKIQEGIDLNKCPF